MPRKEPLARKIFNNLYRNPDDLPVKFSDNELGIKQMYEDAFAKWITDPALSDTHITNLLINEYGRSKTQAWRDVAIIKSVLGDIKNADKEWQRYTVISMLKEAYELAKTKKDPKAMAMAADKLGKYTKLDKDDLDDIPWDEIVPPSFEPSADPQLLGIPDGHKSAEEVLELKRKLKAKYIKSSSITEAEIIEDE